MVTTVNVWLIKDISLEPFPYKMLHLQYHCHLHTTVAYPIDLREEQIIRSISITPRRKRFSCCSLVFCPMTLKLD